MDDSFRAVLSHELYRCATCFNKFAECAPILTDKHSKAAKIDAYNDYVGFVSHLYEFYMGLFSNELKNARTKKQIFEIGKFNAKSKDWEVSDFMLNVEIRKLFSRRKKMFIDGNIDVLTNTIDFYDTSTIPKDFARDFRFVRNFNTHVNTKRIVPVEISVSDFFTKYHKCMLIMFYEISKDWKIDVENYNWEGIEKFAIEVLNPIGKVQAQNMNRFNMKWNPQRIINLVKMRIAFLFKI